MEDQLIDKIRKRFRREWLLVSVTRLEPRTQTPLRGRLLAHSPHKDEIYKRFVTARGLPCVFYSDKDLPHGYAVAFRA